MTKFSDYALGEPILEALAGLGYEAPTPVQAATLPLILGGKDVVGLAETGSGKTAACAIPICNRVDISRPVTQALIIVPTRELALQYASESQKIGKRKGVAAYALFGGEDQGIQMAKLKDGVHILVATPGRLIDLIYQRLIDLSHVETFILDEADEMLSMGFIEDIEFVIQCLIHEHQTLLFSATMPKQVRALAEAHLKDPVEIALNTKRTGPEKLRHVFAFVKSPRDRTARLADLLKETRPKQSIIFCQSRGQTEDLCKALKKTFRDVDYLHGGLGQGMRTTITGKFRSGKIHHLVATDVAARGLDFSGVTHVFHYTLPKDPDSYVHRSGRTGRSGREGVSIGLTTTREFPLLEQILLKVRRRVEWIGEAPTRPKRPSGRATPQRGKRK